MATFDLIFEEPCNIRTLGRTIENEVVAGGHVDTIFVLGLVCLKQARLRSVQLV